MSKHRGSIEEILGRIRGEFSFKTPIPYNINRWFNREGEIGKTEIKYKEMQETTVNDILRMIFKEVLTKE